MTWLFAVAAWVVLICFVSQVAFYWLAISRCSSAVNKWLHALTGSTAIAAIAIVWNRWTWLGLGLAIAVYLATLLLERFSI
ncbi:MAG: hypothetical protein WD738_18075 [Pirellulales bacterium]